MGERLNRFADWFFGDASPSEQRASVPDAPATAEGAGVAPPARTDAERSISPRDAMSLSMVYRAIGIHVISVKQLTLDGWRRMGGITRRLDGDDEPSLLRKPDPETHLPAFLEQTVVSMATSGNAYWLKTRLGRDSIALEVVNAHEVAIRKNLAGRKIGYTYRGRDYDLEDVQHLPLLRFPGTPYGLGPIQAAQVELIGARDLRDYSAYWLKDGDQPNGLLKTDQNISPQQAEAAKERWTAGAQGGHGVRVLGNGLDYAPVYLKPADVQFLETRQFNTTEIARLFGVPASLMLASLQGNSQTYANVEQDWLGYVRFSLMQYLVEIEQALSECLPRGTTARFNVEGLLRPDTTTRYSAHKVALEAGFLTVNEVRAIEGMEPLDAADQPAPAPTKESQDA